MERQKRYKGSVWEFCYANNIFGTFGFEIRACGQKLVKVCAHTHVAKLVVRIGPTHSASIKFMVGIKDGLYIIRLKRILCRRHPFTYC